MVLQNIHQKSGSAYREETQKFTSQKSFNSLPDPDGCGEDEEETSLKREQKEISRTNGKEKFINQK